MSLLHYLFSELLRSFLHPASRRYVRNLTVLLVLGALPLGAEAEPLGERLQIDLSAFVDNLRETNEVTVSGLGTFYLKTRKRYTRRNPHGGEPIVVPAKKYLRFKMSEPLLERVLRDKRAQP